MNKYKIILWSGLYIVLTTTGLIIHSFAIGFIGLLFMFLIVNEAGNYDYPKEVEE